MGLLQNITIPFRKTSLSLFIRLRLNKNTKANWPYFNNRNATNWLLFYRNISFLLEARILQDMFSPELFTSTW